MPSGTATATAIVVVLSFVGGAEEPSWGELEDDAVLGWEEEEEVANVTLAADVEVELVGGVRGAEDAAEGIEDRMKGAEDEMEEMEDRVTGEEDGVEVAEDGMKGAEDIAVRVVCLVIDVGPVDAVGSPTSLCVGTMVDSEAIVNAVLTTAGLRVTPVVKQSC